MDPDDTGGDIIDRLAGLPDAAFGEFDDRNNPIADADEPAEEQAPVVEPQDDAATGEETPEGEDADKPEAEEPQKPEKTDEKTDDTGEDYVEIPGEDGAEPERVPLATLVEHHQKFKALDSDLLGVRNQLETAFTQKMTPVLQQQIEVRDQYIQRYEKILEWSPVGNPPDPEVYLNPKSEHYDPQAYELHKAQYERRKALHEKALAHIEGEKKKLEEDKSQAWEAHLDREAQNLARAWPELASPKAGEIMAEFYQGLRQHYGLDEETAKSVTDHRFHLVARDALLYRKMASDKGGAVKAKAAAKLVRGAAKPAAAASASAAAKKAREALRKSGSIDAAAAAFEGLDL